MFRNCLSAAWGDLIRSPLQSFIAIGGLAIGLMAAILAGIVAINQASYDHFVPGFERLYYAVIENHGGSVGDSYLLSTPHDLGAYLRQNLPDIEAVTRRASASTVMRHGNIQAKEKFYWVDPNFFDLYPVPVLYGNLDAALARPDGMVIPLQTARKYFGRDNAVGQTLELDHRYVMTVRAVIADLPANAATVSSGIFASALSSHSTMVQDASRPGMSPDGSMSIDMTTLVRLEPGASLDALNRGATALVSKFVPRSQPYRRAMHFERVDRLHLSPQLNPDTRPRLVILAAAAVVILILAIVNFVNLSTARSAQRGVEVAVRKTSGSSRGALVTQFLGEFILQVMFALVLAVMLVELSLPAVNNFLIAGAVFDYWHDPMLLLLLLAGAATVGVVAGAYPALILSSFRPAIALKGSVRHSTGGEMVRQGLVTLQFAALIMLLIAAAVVFRQNQYATTEALRVDADQMLFIRMPKCDDALKNRIGALPGVRGAACSSTNVLPETFNTASAAPRHGGDAVTMSMAPVGVGFFELYGLKPVAGRFFRSVGDAAAENPTLSQTVHYVVNETAVRQLGYATPQAAIGQPLNFPNTEKALHEPSQKPGSLPKILSLQGSIIGVVPDFSFAPGSPSIMSRDRHIPAFAYSVGEASVNLAPQTVILHVKLSGHDIPETLAAIDMAWKQSGTLDPIDRTFVDAYVQGLQIAVLRQGQAFAVLAGIAMLLACLGLFGVALSTAARRTKEIGIRKAMGATSSDVVLLLLWQFSQPVLWANLIAWPLAWWMMDQWLSGFPYHVDLSAWLFPAAGATTLLIALAAVLGQAVLVARQKPVLALRYE